MKRYIKSARSSSAYSPKGASASHKQKTRGSNGFDANQQKQIELGKQAGVDTSIYADPEYDGDQMRVIREGLEAGVDVSIYADPAYEWYQMSYILDGLEAGVDVSIYADPAYGGSEMGQILEGLESGLDVSLYADPRYSDSQMEQIRLGLESGLDVSIYADLKYNFYQMAAIRKGLESGVDVSIYADPEYDASQMADIRLGLEDGLDVSIYADPKFGWGQMWEILLGLRAGVDASIYADPRYDEYQMEAIREGLIKYADDPDIDAATPEQIATAYKKNAPSLAYVGKSKYGQAKDRWSAIKQAVQSRQPLDVAALEDEFNLVPLEGRAASTLNITFDENSDGSVTFITINGEDLGTLSAQEYDLMVKAAIANSSTRSSFAKAFATQLKHTLGL